MHLALQFRSVGSGPYSFKGGWLNMIKKVKGGYKVVSSKGRNLGGPYKTLEEAKQRLRQVEFFKHKKT
jgi:hypothetical protein